MQCFICVIYLVTLCKALPSKHCQLSTFENKTVSFSKDNVTSELTNDMDSGPQLNDKVDIRGTEIVTETPSEMRIKVTGINLESVHKRNVIDDTTLSAKTESNDITIKPAIESTTHELTFSEINKEYIKHIMTTWTKGNDQLLRPILNEMEDLSQIGDSDRLTIINPTVIVNFRGTVLNKDSDIKFAQKKKDKRKPENMFD